MNDQHLSNTEIAARLAGELRAWRVSPSGAGFSQVELARRSGVGLTPLKRFEKTGAITLRNLIAILRALNLLDGLQALVPAPDDPGPLAILASERQRSQRLRARRTKKTSPTPAPA